jgi:hypothetical protein
VQLGTYLGIPVERKMSVPNRSGVGSCLAQLRSTGDRSYITIGTEMWQNISPVLILLSDPNTTSFT